MADDHDDFKGFCRFGIRSGELDVAHFFAHQILDDADFGDLICSADFECLDLFIGQDLAYLFMAMPPMHEGPPIEP